MAGINYMSFFRYISEALRKKSVFYLLLVFIVGIIPLFYNLGVPVLTIWDESRSAVNSWEMYKNGHLLVTYFNGEPEMWGTKPPFLQWIQVLSIMIFGANEWAFRFPSAIAGLFLGFSVLLFCGYYLQSFLLGFASVLILYTTNAFINVHAVRTGDFDSLLILFTTAASFFFFLGIESENKNLKSRYIIYFFISITFAALTKGIAAFLLVPAYFFYIIFRRDLGNWLKNKNFWIGTGILILFVAGYYALRNFYNPGYLTAMINNEPGRFFKPAEQNVGPIYYYLKIFFQFRFKTWYFLIPLGILFGYLSNDRKLKRLLTYLLLLTITYFLIISIAKTKLMWYDLQIMPYVSMISAIFFLFIFRSLKTSTFFTNRNFLTGYIPFFILMCFFAAPYFNIYKQNRSVYLPYQDIETHRISHYLRDIEKGKQQAIENFTIIYEGEFQHFLFYVYKLRVCGYDIDFTGVASVKSGNNYIVYQENVLKQLSNNFKVLKKTPVEGIYSIWLQPN